MFVKNTTNQVELIKEHTVRLLKQLEGNWAGVPELPSRLPEAGPRRVVFQKDQIGNDVIRFVYGRRTWADWRCYPVEQEDISSILGEIESGQHDAQLQNVVNS